MTSICSAHRTNGDPCRAPAIRGGRVCVVHGGKAPQVRESARQRLLAFVDPALDQLRRLLDSADSDAVKLAAARDILDRCGYRPADKIEVESNGKMMIEIEYISQPLPATQNGHVLE